MLDGAHVVDLPFFFSNKVNVVNEISHMTDHLTSWII